MTPPTTQPGSVLAVDVGGTLIKGWVVDRAGTVLHREDVPTPVTDGPQAVLDAVLSLTHRLTDHGAVDAVGVVVPGLVDEAGGIARYSANLGWRDVPVRARVSAALGHPTVLGHDVSTAGLAERMVGAARDATDALVVVIGTGIAALLICDGRIVRGATGIAGELGHVQVYADGEVCGCGRRGCLEAYASAASISRRYRQAGGSPLTTPEVVAALDTDPVARQVWDEAVEAMGVALSAATMLLDPQVIVLSGGLAEAGEALAAPVREALTAGLGWRATPDVVSSRLGARAGRVGAAILAWQAAGLTDFAAWTDAEALLP